MLSVSKRMGGRPTYGRRVAPAGVNRGAIGKDRDRPSYERNYKKGNQHAHEGVLGEAEERGEGIEQT